MRKAAIYHPEDREVLAGYGKALAADLAAETSYGKRNVLNELEPLRFAGIVKSYRAVNADRFSLAQREHIGQLVRPLPQRFTAWTPTFATLHLVLDLARRSAKRGDLQNAVDAVRLLDERKALFATAGIHLPPLPAGPAAWPAFLTWTETWTRSLARV